MFAVRFDPTKIVEEPKNEPKKIIPLKRRKSVNDDGESDEEEEKEDEPVKADDEDIPENEEHQSESDSEPEEESEPEPLIEDDTTLESEKKHTSVLSRFQQTISLQDKMHSSDLVPEKTENTADQEIEDEDVDMDVHDLEHIPQPAVVRTSKEDKQSLKENKSIAWINTTKVHYDNTMIKPYTSYQDSLEPKLLNNITKYFSNDTFPIQTILLDTLLPVLNFSQRITKKNFTRRVGDILVNASTGSGKTLAYSIPIVQTLSKRSVNKLRALIIVPTKLLIHQVYDTLSKLSQGTSLIISISKLESSLKEEHQKLQNLEPDVLIITPGRLVDHLNMGSISLKNLKMLVLDEADRLLNQSFQNWCFELMNRLKTDKLDQMPGNVIKMVFSATLTTNTQKLHDLNLYSPKLFVMDSVKLYHLPAMLQEFNINIPTAKSLYKPLLLLRLLKEQSTARILVFAKSNEASLRLATLLNILINKNMENLSTTKRYEITSINSNNSKSENKKLVATFAAAATDENINKILITTDLMSRGVDITNVTDVINYDVPISSQQYVHRCGRTARANTKGNVYNMLVGKGERNFWSQHIDNDVARDVNGFTPKLWGVQEEVEQPEEEEEDSKVRTNAFLQISKEEDAIYKECLQNLKEQSMAHN
ncbi:hypothetical protein NCAS_0A05470 [Naumovozyma castellii]|uniref:ATP-dependent RNA helicase n=1 Tax=Naumovozyma castellii TaxID=27288 RepID=G0V6K9_NAUCA|nr:hypothetical protein NCAS_0A05470 [Naumovozyma castellii CBS 4309]CCC67105.1 hypothetical protein NCAS_0A05470 [Naumovozyma castellii CBS 4309]